MSFLRRSRLGHLGVDGSNRSGLRGSGRAVMAVLLIGASAGMATSCANSDPLGGGASDGAIVIGSQDYFSNEIIAEIYAQALEERGLEVDRQFRIGQREVYVPEIEAGTIDLFPEYTGPLLKYWQPETTARSADEVYSALMKATPAKLRVLEQSPATDQDTYVVTADFAQQWNLKSLTDLKKVTDPLVLGANSEAEKRPNGPIGLKDTYGLDVDFSPIEDSGGAVTVRALKDKSVNMAIMYTASPSISDNGFVELEDPKNLLLASHVVPLASSSISPEAEEIINTVSASMTPEDLVELNRRSITDKQSAKVIAADWLAEN